MQLDLFSAGDTVLLVGEGNFSFAVGLTDLNLPITLTASCLQTDNLYLSARENIAHLKQKGVRVLQGVDGTNLKSHPIVGNEKFSKIIFNFPHVGGKMKIQLNRALLQNFFTSASELIALNGRILVSLCKGQGGTKVDRPMRRKDDTWQVVEMAAHANLVLESVEPFRTDLFPNYRSVGYRGGVAAFHTNGALVHVFCKREALYSDTRLETLSHHLEGHVLQTKFGEVRCSHLHSVMYRNNLFKCKGSAVNFLYEELLTDTNKTGAGDDVVLHVELPRCSLHHSPFDSLYQVLNIWNKNVDNIVIFPGLVFNELGPDFSHPPLSCYILLLGNGVLDAAKCYVSKMLQMFKKDDIYNSVITSQRVAEFRWKYSSGKCILINSNVRNEMEPVLVAQQHDVKLHCKDISACVIFVDKLAELLFNVGNWRQMWTKQTEVICNNSIPVLKYACFESETYTLDITFCESEAFSLAEFYSILWQLASEIIINVQFLNQYESSRGWTSQCYRITYQSFDKALCRKQAIDIQQNIIGRILCEKLGVSIR